MVVGQVGSLARPANNDHGWLGITGVNAVVHVSSTIMNQGLVCYAAE